VRSRPTSRTSKTFDDLLEALIPDEWLRKEFEKFLSEEEKAKIQSLGGLDKLIEEFRKRLAEQKERHQGGNKWIGTGGTSPFGSGGYNPEGIRVGPKVARGARSRSGRSANSRTSMIQRRTGHAQHQACAAPAAQVRPQRRRR
jgi:uncharacterized protein with von Willebrand factor type A (vWA) domain